jgi:cytidylate kinase
VLTVDGPSGSGKGTVGRIVAERLGWHFLDSGALYRLLALAADRRGIPLDDDGALTRLAARLDVSFVGGDATHEPTVLLDGEAVTRDIRSETCGNNASRVAALAPVREALLARQRAFRRPPGLVADGRDMGTVVFPDAQAKVFLDASPEERAERRHNQLIEKGIDASLPTLVAEIAERDARDLERSAAPLKAAPGAIVVDTTGLSIDAVVDRVMQILAGAGWPQGVH